MSIRRPPRLSVVTGALLAGLVLGSACQGPGPDAGRMAAGLGPAGASVSVAPLATGFLRLTIHWPVRDFPGFRAADIPTSTNAIYVRVNKAGSQVADELIARPQGGGPTVTQLRVPIGNDLGVEVYAYREAAPDVATAQPIARAFAPTVIILPSLTTRVALILDALEAPAITALSAPAGRVGDRLTLAGVNFGLVNGATPSVTFKSAAGVVPQNPTGEILAAVTPIDARTLEVDVPSGAAVGAVAVTNDGIRTRSPAQFWVATGLAIGAPREPWDTSPTGTQLAYYGFDLPFGALPAWVFAPGQSASDFGPAPAVTWTSSAAAGEENAINTAGTLAVARRNDRPTTVQATLATLISNALTIVPVGVDAVTLDLTDLTLNALPDDGAADAAFAGQVTQRVIATVTTTLPFNNGVVWQSADPARVTVDPTGLLATIADAPAGVATVTAWAADGGPYLGGQVATESASVTVTVTRRGNLFVGVR